MFRIDGDQEPPRRLDRGPLTLLDRPKHLVGQLPGSVNNDPETSRWDAALIGELTPTQKATRAVVYSRFRDVIDSLHE